MNPQELKQALSSGLLSFPLTDFDANLQFNKAAYTKRLEWLMPYGATVLFAAGGTGEFFSLEPGEFTEVVRTAVETCKGDTPIVAGAGGGTTLAIQYAQAAEKAGAVVDDHADLHGGADGLHVVDQAFLRSFGQVVRQQQDALRAGMRLSPASLEQLAEQCPNLIGYKDGVGDIELMVSIRQRLGDRFSYLGGLPTAEVFAHAYRALGVPVYSSAVFNFIPKTAMEFYNAYAKGDLATTDRLIKDFFLPYLEIRNRGHGYAVSIVKAGATIIGHSAGPVRPPISDLKPAEVEDLRALIAKLGPQ